MSLRADLGLGSIHQHSVSTASPSQEHSSPSDDIAAGEHGTRPTISPLGTCKVLIDDTGITPRSDYDVEDTRPPPAPSISDAKPHFTLTLPLNKQRTRKGCLKQLSPLSSPSLSSPDASPALNYATFYHTLSGPGCKCSRGSSGSSTPQKSVSWCSQDRTGLGYLEEVFPADDWDRTPTEPVRTPLSYKDILELKAIQRTLPHAQQLPDPFTGRPANQYLSDVPIALLPLLPDSAPHTPNVSPNSSTGVTPNGSGSNTPSNISPRESTQPSPRGSPTRSPNRSPERGSSPSLPAHAHLPRISSPLAPPHPPSGKLAPPPRAKPMFNFVPLLDPPAPPPVDSIPQALNAALGNLCHSHRPFSLHDEDSPPPTPALTLGGDSCSEELSDIGEDIPFGVMFRKDAEGSYDSYSRWRGRPSEKEETKNKNKNKNVLYINGEEIELDGEDKDEKPAASKEKDVIYINGEACTLDDPKPSPSSTRSPSPESERRPRSHVPISPFHRAHPNLTRTPSPEKKAGSHSHAPISPFHRAHPNILRSHSRD